MRKMWRERTGRSRWEMGRGTSEREGIDGRWKEADGRRDEIDQEREKVNEKREERDQ